MFEDFNDDGFIVSESMAPQNALALNIDISKMVTKIRRIVKIFKQSLFKNETLQTYVKENYPNGPEMWYLIVRLDGVHLLICSRGQFRLNYQFKKALLDLGEDI